MTSAYFKHVQLLNFPLSRKCLRPLARRQLCNGHFTGDACTAWVPFEQQMLKAHQQINLILRFFFSVLLLSSLFRSPQTTFSWQTYFTRFTNSKNFSNTLKSCCALLKPQTQNTCLRRKQTGKRIEKLLFARKNCQRQSLKFDRVLHLFSSSQIKCGYYISFKARFALNQSSMYTM